MNGASFLVHCVYAADGAAIAAFPPLAPAPIYDNVLYLMYGESGMYEVRIANGNPVVVNQQGALVPNAHVKSIEFPHISLPNLGTNVNVLAGPAMATILVDGAEIPGVPVR